MYRVKHYFIRHAHREDFKPNDWGHDVSITEEGQNASFELGEALAKSGISAVWTSPVKRCIQTGQKIRDAMEADIPIHFSSLLGDPGFMIFDPQSAAHAFRKFKFFELVDLLLGGEKLPGFYPLDISCKKILKEIFGHKISAIWVTHDIIICSLACWIFHADRSESMFPEFLEGIEFSFEEEGIYASFKGLRTKIDETQLRGVLCSSTKPPSSNRE